MCVYVYKGFFGPPSTINNKKGTRPFSHTNSIPPNREPTTHHTTDHQPTKQKLDWEPKVDVREGLSRTIEYFRKELEETGAFGVL